jgi:hypothetical protein
LSFKKLYVFGKGNILYISGRRSTYRTACKYGRKPDAMERGGIAFDS